MDPRNQLSWTEIFRDEYEFVHIITRRLAGPSLDPDDLSQEVFMVVFRKLESLRDPARLRSWLYGICRRVASDQRRRQRLRSRLAELFGKTCPDVQSRTPESEASQHELEKKLYSALDVLSDKKREVLILYALEGMDGKDIADLLQIPVATVWTRLHHARKDLLRHLEKEGFPIAKRLKELAT